MTFGVSEWRKKINTGFHKEHYMMKVVHDMISNFAVMIKKIKFRKSDQNTGGTY